jgi:hypothetical protein
MKNNTPKHFALQLGSLISLYLSLSFLLVLMFGLINLLFPDAADMQYMIESASDSVRFGIAMVVVAFPTYLILTRLINTTRRADTHEQYLTLTKWLIYLSLVVAIGALLVDLVTVVYTLLQGEITSRFIFKALAVLVIIGAAVFYYVLDARGYWLKNEQKSVWFALAATIVVVASLGLGIMQIDTPTVVREQKLDAKQVSDLQNIQYKIQEAMVTSSGTLPTSLESAYGAFPIPTAPEGRAAYRYEVTETGFNLCATFAEPMKSDVQFSAPIMDKQAVIINPDDWQYKAGDFCFTRIVRK